MQCQDHALYLHEIWIVAGEAPWGRRRRRGGRAAALTFDVHAVDDGGAVAAWAVLLLLPLVALGHGRVARDRPDGRGQLHLAWHDVVHGGALGKGPAAVAVADELPELALPPLLAALQDQIQDEHDDDGQHDDGGRPEAKDILDLQHRCVRSTVHDHHVHDLILASVAYKSLHSIA